MARTLKFKNDDHSLWMDRVTRNLLESGLLKEAIEKWSVTGLISSLTDFGYAIKSSPVYDAAILRKIREIVTGENLFFEVVLEDLRQAAGLFQPIYQQTEGVDGWVSLEIPPLSFHDPDRTFAAVKDLYGRARRPNLMIAIPGIRENLALIEKAIFNGIPVNVTYLFSTDQYLAAAEAYLCGIERRMAADLGPNVGSIASMYISRWDASVTYQVPEELQNRLGITVAECVYKAYRQLLESPRWKAARKAGARAQRLLWSGPLLDVQQIPNRLNAKTLTAPFTVSSLSRDSLPAMAVESDFGAKMPMDGGDCEVVLARFAKAGIDLTSLAARLQQEEIDSFVKVWIEIMAALASKCAELMTGRNTATADH